MQVIPAVDVLGGRVVRLMRGSYAAVKVYGSNPTATARQWVDSGAALVHVVDLEGARTGQGSRRLWADLAEAEVPFQVGGGVRDPATAGEAVAAGAARVVVGTTAVWNAAALGEIVAAVGADRVVAAVDVRRGRAAGAGWTDAGRDLGTVLDGIAEAGVARALVTGISRDGTLEGPDIELLTQVQGAVPELALIASGGVSSLDDLRGLAALGMEAVVVGRALYERRFGLEDAIRVAAGER